MAFTFLQLWTGILDMSFRQDNSTSTSSRSKTEPVPIGTTPTLTEELALKLIEAWQAFFLFLMKKNEPLDCLMINMMFLWCYRTERLIQTISLYIPRVTGWSR